MACLRDHVQSMVIGGKVPRLPRQANAYAVFRFVTDKSATWPGGRGSAGWEKETRQEVDKVIEYALPFTCVVADSHDCSWHLFPVAAWHTKAVRY